MLSYLTQAYESSVEYSLTVSASKRYILAHLQALLRPYPPGVVADVSGQRGFHYVTALFSYHMPARWLFDTAKDYHGFPVETSPLPCTQMVCTAGDSLY